MSTQRRGRPPLADPAQLRAQVVQVLNREGWKNVSMREIADQVGVSVRTLHRYFPTKADIVWGDVDDSFDTLRAALAAASDDLSIIETVIEVVVEALGPLDERPGWERDRIRMIATNPDLQVIHSHSFLRWRRELAAFIARRMGEPEGSLVAATSGAAMQAVMMHSLAWWATHPDSCTPAGAMTEALRGLARTSSMH